MSSIFYFVQILTPKLRYFQSKTTKITEAAETDTMERGSDTKTEFSNLEYMFD